MGRTRLETEFGRYAEWLADAILSVGLEDAVPAACRGTANPLLFKLVADAIDPRPGSLVLDIGCGIGGPAAWMGRESDCRVIGVDVMQHAVRSLRRLFPELSALVASSRALPFESSSIDGAMMLGVMETIAAKDEALSEIARVLVPGARVVIYTHLWRERAADAPAADRFETRERFEQILATSRLSVLRSESMHDFPAPPEDWREVARRARTEVERIHGSDPGFAAAATELAKIARLIRETVVAPWLYVLVKHPKRETERPPFRSIVNER